MTAHAPCLRRKALYFVGDLIPPAVSFNCFQLFQRFLPLNPAMPHSRKMDVPVRVSGKVNLKALLWVRGVASCPKEGGSC